METGFDPGYRLYHRTLADAWPWPVLDILRFPAKLIELLIPITILIAAITNVLPRQEGEFSGRAMRINYAFALFFGLIHGMGFSNFLRSALMPGQEGQLVGQLFAFNVGIELGQLMIVAFIMLLAFLALRVMNIRQNAWNLFVSGAAAGISLTLLLNQW